MDLTYNIRRLISPIADVECGTKELEIRALDDLDERYLIRTKDGDGIWLNCVKSPLCFEKLCSPEKGVIEVTVRKNYPKYRRWLDHKKFLKDVEAYFMHACGDYLRMTEERETTKSTCSRLITNDEGDEIGWEYYDVDDYVGSAFILDSLGYSRAWGEDKKTFILRKLEAIFNQNGAFCNVKTKEFKILGEMYRYEFCIDVAS